MNELLFASIATITKLIRTKQLSAAQVLSFYMKRFEQYDGKIKSALQVFDAQSILARSQTSGTLYGVPGLIKDNICQRGRVTACGSKILERYHAVYDATVVARLHSQGALCIGRANMDEFGMGSSTEYSAFQKTHNPWNLERVPGGSSGGSAAAVAAGLVPWALGSETGGSVRQPAAFCGVVGLKPTYGAVSRYGLVAYGSSLDQVGVCARTVQDTATVFSVLAGHDPRDGTSLSHAPRDYAHGIGESVRGIKMGVVMNAFDAQGMRADVRALLDATLKTYENMGVTLVPITIPSMDYAAAVYFILSRAEAASNLARFDGVRYGLRASGTTSLAAVYQKTRAQGFGPTVRRRIMIGNYVLSQGYAAEFYGSAKRVQQLMRHELANALAQVDVLCMPVHGAPAFAFGEFEKNTLQMDLQDYFTAFCNITGAPALAVPCGFTQGLPVGFQLIGPHMAEALLFRVGHAYEQEAGWYKQQPVI